MTDVVPTVVASVRLKSGILSLEGEYEEGAVWLFVKLYPSNPDIVPSETARDGLHWNFRVSHLLFREVDYRGGMPKFFESDPEAAAKRLASYLRAELASEDRENCVAFLEAALRNGTPVFDVMRIMGE